MHPRPQTLHSEERRPSKIDMDTGESGVKARFVSEQLRPVAGSMDTAQMARARPGLPRRFMWRDKEYAVAEVLQTWTETSPCSHGSGERYVRKHWFELRTTDGSEMKIYFERQAKSKRQHKRRWWLYTLSTPERD